MVRRQETGPGELFARAIRSPGGVLRHLKEVYNLKTRDLDIETFCEVLSDLTETSENEVLQAYEECVFGEPMDEYNRQVNRYLSRSSSARLYKRFVGPEKFARLDRIALYCIVRTSKPDVMVETGVNWGESSYFILKALEMNDKGNLYSFDAGYDVASSHYNMPSNVSDIGFIVPDQLYNQWEIIVGDSISEMKSYLGSLPSIDIFYHDSKHTYDHMMGEYEIVINHMADQSILMSEDIDQNAAWADFLEKNQDILNGDLRYYSMQGIENSREIGATKVCKSVDVVDNNHGSVE